MCGSSKRLLICGTQSGKVNSVSSLTCQYNYLVLFLARRLEKKGIFRSGAQHHIAMGDRLHNGLPFPDLPTPPSSRRISSEMFDLELAKNLGQWRVGQNPKSPKP